MEPSPRRIEALSNEHHERRMATPASVRSKPRRPPGERCPAFIMRRAARPAPGLGGGKVRRWAVCVGLGAAVVLVGGCRRKTDATDKTPDAEPVAKSWFTEITRQVGLDFVHESGARGDRLMPEVMASGVALFDYDNDSDLDIYCTNGNRALPRLDGGSDTPNRMYRQEADGRFVDVTAASGLGDTGYGTGVAIGDIDNDGDLDVYVANVGRDRLYRNRGNGTFADISDAAGITVDGWSASVCFFDYDADGFLDIYVSRYVRWDATKKCFAPDGRPTYCGPLSFMPDHDVLLHNDGGAAFTDVTQEAGIGAVKAAGLGVVCQDFNDDGRQDVYVANDAYRNQLWINQGDGTFRDEAIERGVGYNLNGEPEAGMGVIAADFDNDGYDDLFMTHLGQETNTLYRNLGADMGFMDGTSGRGLGWSSVPYTGFGTVAFDVELDGDLDIFIVNGRVKRAELIQGAAAPPPWDVLAEPNLFYLNDGTGRFKLLTEPVASLCEPVEISRGLVAGDIDADGDMDLVLTNLHGPARLYRNDVPRTGAWLMVRAWHPELHRDAIGARVTVVCGGRRLVRTVGRAYSYLSSGDSRVHFGLGDVVKVDRIEIDWKDGLRERFSPVPINRYVELVRGTGTGL